MPATRLSSVRTRASARPGRFLPRLERLEERTVPDTVTWVGGSGDWNTPTNWDAGRLPGPTDDALIYRAGITVTHTSGIHRINRLATANGTFQLSGGTLDIATTVSGDSTFQLNGGRLANATIVAGTTLRGGGFRSTLDRLTLAPGATLIPAGTDVVNGMVVDGTVHLGGDLSFRGTQSLLGFGRVLMGHGLGGARILQTEAGGTLTLGPNLTIQLQRGDIHSEGSLVNQATITTTGPDAYILVIGAAQPWINAGVIRVEGRPGEFESGLHGTWTNTGEISVTDNARHGTFLHLRGNYWTNRGTIRTTNAALGLGGTFRPSAIGNLVRSGGVITLRGTLDVRGETHEFNARTGSWVCGGTILGGAVVFRDGARLTAMAPWGCVMDGVTFNSDVDWATDQNQVYVRNGLTVNGTLRLGNANGSTSATLIFQGNSTVNVTGGVVCGSAGFVVDEPSSVLTVAANTVLRGGRFGIVGRLINHGTLLADTDGGGFTITSSNFLNEGTLRAENGGSMTLRGTWVTRQPVQFSGPGRLTFDGTWSYPFPLTVTGGWLTLAGTWSYAFPLTVTSGRLNLAGNWRLSEPLTVRGSLAEISSTTAYTLTAPLSVESGGQLRMNGRWTNQATVTATNSLVWLGESDTWTNRGTITVNNCTVVMRGNITTDDLGTIVRTGGTVELAATLDNTGRTLALDERTGPWLFSGRILRGTVTTNKVALLATGVEPSLIGVVFNGQLDASMTNNTRIRVFEGLVLNGRLRLGNDAGTRSASLEFSSTQTLGTQTGGTVVFGGGINTRIDIFGSNTRLTIAPNVLIRGKNGSLRAFAGSFHNQGTIQADVLGGTITLNATGWTNSGTIRALNGATLLAQGTTTNYASGTLTGGTWGVHGQSRLSLTGDIVTNAAVIHLDGPAARIVNQFGADALLNFAANAPAGQFILQNGSALATASPFRNAGAFVVSGGSLFVSVGSYTQADGVTVLDGGVVISAGGVDIAGGFLTGSGLIAGNVVNRSWLDVGGVGTAGYLVIAGDYTQTADALLTMELGDPVAGNYDQLLIGGTATLDGTLSVGLLGGYVAREGDVFPLLAAAALTGRFARLDLPDLGPELFLEAFYDPAALVLTVSRRP